MRRSFVLAAAAAAALTTLASAQGGSFPGARGLIAFTCGSSVCTAGEDGTVYGSPLISSANDPSWSPDGSRLAYVQSGNVYTANADGTGAQLFVSNATQPTWAPSGTTIAYVTPTGISTLTAGGSPQPVTSSGTDADPAYGPDGRLAYASKGAGSSYDIYIAGAATPIVSTPADDVAPSWSPDGKKLVFSSGGEIETVDLGNGQLTDLNVGGLDPSFSPDGGRISYATIAGNLSVMNSDGTGAHALNTFLPASQTDWGSGLPPSGPSGNTGNGPANTSYPAISLASGDSVPVIGHLLSATVGGWSPPFGNTYTFQWKRCEAGDPVNGACFAIAGATSSVYVPLPADFGWRLRVAVSASNSSGRTTQNSEVTAPTIALAPRNTATPQVTPGGQNQVDQKLSLTAGAWAGSTPLAFTYSWRRCNPVGDLGSCVPIVGATAVSYTPTVADIGFSLRVWITGSNLAGSDTAVTNHTFPIVDKPHFAPSVATAPVIAGTALPGRQLTANVGAYQGDNPIATSFHWYRCDATGAACHAIPDATKVVYHPTQADVGFTLRLFVLATNAYGKLVAQSSPTAAVAANPPHVRGRYIVGTERGDYLAGGGHDDTIIGLRGNDTLLGGAGDDRIDGGRGNDVITGGSGADRIVAGPGSDTVNAADGERDVVDCGSGSDRAVVDPYDVVRGCEVVERAPVG